MNIFKIWFLAWLILKLYKTLNTTCFHIYLCRRKFQIRISEQEEQVESLMARCTALEKQKSRLQSEVEVLIIDLEKVKITTLLWWLF